MKKYVIPLLALNATKWLPYQDVINIATNVEYNILYYKDKSTGEVITNKATFFTSGLYPFNELYILSQKMGMRWGVSVKGHPYFMGKYLMKLHIEEGSLIVTFE